MKVSYREINHRALITTLQKLNNHPLEIKTAYAIKKITDAIIKEIKTFRELYEKLGFKYASKDENGLPQFKDGMPVVDPAQMGEFEKEMNEFLAIECEIQQSKIDVSKLASVKMTGVELAVLEPFIEGLEKLEEPTPAA
jgi:repressor of nif and glnA expression